MPLYLNGTVLSHLIFGGVNNLFCARIFLDFAISCSTDDEIIGRYELVTKHIYPNEFIEMRDMINKKQLIRDI